MALTTAEIKARYEAQLEKALDAMDRILLTGQAYEIGTGPSKRRFDMINIKELEDYIDRLRVKISELDTTTNRTTVLRAGW